MYQWPKTGTVKGKSNEEEETSDTGQEKVQWRNDSATVIIVDTVEATVTLVPVLVCLHQATTLNQYVKLDLNIKGPLLK